MKTVGQKNKKIKEQLTKKEIIPIGLILAAILVGIWFYPSLPDEIAVI